jgi:hypothetical protein
METTTRVLSFAGSQLLAALLASVGFWWRARIDRRDNERRYRALLSRVRDEIQVVETFMKAYVLVAPSDEEMQTTTAKAREHLGLTYGVFDDARTAWYDAQRSRTEDRIRPHWPLAITAVILFPPTGVIAVIFANRVRRSTAVGGTDAARSTSRLVVRMFWITIAIFFLLMLFLLVV